jgi:hypothetical protein
VRYCYYKDLKKSFIITGLKETTLLKNPQPNKKLLDNFLKLYERQNKTKKRKSQLSEKDNLALYFKNKMLEIARKSINEKDLREKLLSEYNIQLKLKKRKGRVIGYTFIKDGTEHYFKDEEIIKISDLREILKNNSQNKKINLPVVYKKELKHEELEEFNKRIRKTITRANISKFTVNTEIKRADRKLQSIHEQIHEQRKQQQEQQQSEFDNRERQRNKFIKRYDRKIKSREQQAQSRKSILDRTIGTIKGTISSIRNEISRFKKYGNRLPELTKQIRTIARITGNYIVRYPRMWNKIDKLENFLDTNEINQLKDKITLKKTEMMRKQRKNNGNYLSL